MEPNDLDLPSAEAMLEELNAQPRSDGPLAACPWSDDQVRRASSLVLKAGESSTPLDTLVRQFIRGEVSDEQIGSLLAAMRRKWSETGSEPAEARAAGGYGITAAR